MKNCFLNTGGGSKHTRKKNQVHRLRFADDMTLLEEDERMLKNMLMEQNERCEDYGMKINISKTKVMVIGRKPKKIDIRIEGEFIEQVDSFKYLWCNISSNMNCCQEVKQRISMAKEAFNRKRSIFCGPLEKELRKRLVKCFVWSVVLYGAETWTLRRNEQKQLDAFEMWVWRRMECVKWTDKIKKSVVLEKVGEGMVNGRRRYQMIDNIMIN